ncbi:hypothetical protein ES703_118842 [subsurface metagenome]
MVEKAGISGRSIASMVVGICSLPLFIPIPLPGMIPGLGLILGIVAIVLAAIELKAIAKGKVDPRSRGFAVAGMATGIMGTLSGVLFIVFFGAVASTVLAAIAAALKSGQIPIPK